jgi:hypothetical protein
MASLPEMRRTPLFASDIRQLGGVVSVQADRDRCDGEPIFRVSHVSGGGDVAFVSMAILLEDHANAAARVLAEFVGAKPGPDANRLEGAREVRLASTRP